MNSNDKAKRILCYGDSNTWGWVPGKLGMERFSVQERWPGILQRLLGADFEVIEEGLGARTTMFDDPRPEFPERNGLKTLPMILASHLPLDLVMIMLGTSDTKEMMKKSSEEITEGMRKLILTIKNYKMLTGTFASKILIVAPPIVREETDFASTLFKGASAKARELIELYKILAEREEIFYLNPTDDTTVDAEEGVHLDAINHQRLAELFFKKIKGIQPFVACAARECAHACSHSAHYPRQ